MNRKVKIPEFYNTENTEYIVGEDQNKKKIWHSRSVAVNAVIIAKVKGILYLLTGLRGKGCPDYVGYWNVPCGYLDWDENGTDACYREIWEETGLNLKQFIDSSEYYISHIDNPWSTNTEPTINKQNVSFRYGAFVHAKKLPKLTTKYSEKDEVEKLEWMKIDNITDLDSKEWAFSHKKLIKMYIQKIGLLNHG